ncbi:MAG: TraR/DksA family transcriptional regulator [Pseudomonadales bacterium]
MMERHERISRHTRHREEPLPADFAEQAVELENGETLIALDQELEAEIKKIDRALARIESGDYAYCESCGEAIGDDRLDAVPVTVLCIDCANDKSLTRD